MKNKSALAWLFEGIKGRVPELILLTLASAGNAIFGVLFALGTKNVINSAVGGSREALMAAAIQQALIILGILACLTLQRFLHARLNARLDRDWKQRLTAKILQSDYVSISNYHSGELINRLNNDVRTIDEGLLSALPELVSMAAKVVAVVAVLMAMAPVFTFVLLAAGAVVALVTGFARRYLRELNKQVSAADGKVSGFLQEVFEKLLLVQAMNVEKETLRRGDVVLQDRYALQKKRWMLTLMANTFVAVLAYGSGFGALVWCATGLLHGTMTFGELTAVTQLVSQLQTPFVNLSGILPKYIAMTAACERLMELEKDCGKMEMLEKAAVSYREVEAICARNLTFSYDRDTVFENSSFRLPKGSFAVITGPSGIGKSTLLKLLLGIWKPKGGTLTLSCEDGEIPADRSTRALFAYVPQGNLLFSGTLRENLLLTCPEATEEQIERAVYVSNMDAFLPQLPQGLDTVLGENAHGLSEGQAQRLSIARAILSGAPILLLDEATSALDAETEKTVLERLRALPGKTCIAVTHRPAALALADRQLEIANGRIECKEIG